MHYKLKFTYDKKDRWADERGSVFYFCNLGGFWHGKGDTRRLIERTTTQLEQAREFATVEQAREILTLTDNLSHPSWQVVDAEGRVVE